MAKALVETPGAKLVSDTNVEWELKLAYDTEEASGLPILLLHAYQDGVFRGTIGRPKLSGDRLAMDFPGLDPEFFIVDGDGHITNG
jgi:hypothetical protein